MTKAWCIWCETGQIPKHGYYWIHPECFERMDSIHRDIESLEKYLKGELPRIDAEGNIRGHKTVEDFLVSMADFDRRWRNLRKLTEALESNTLDQVVFEKKEPIGGVGVE